MSFDYWCLKGVPCIFLTGYTGFYPTLWEYLKCKPDNDLCTRYRERQREKTDAWISTWYMLIEYTIYHSIEESIRIIPVNLLLVRYHRLGNQVINSRGDWLLVSRWIVLASLFVPEQYAPCISSLSLSCPRGNTSWVERTKCTRLVFEVVLLWRFSLRIAPSEAELSARAVSQRTWNFRFALQLELCIGHVSLRGIFVW